MVPIVTALYRYPVKGLTGQRLKEVLLEKGEGISGDRIIAIAREPGLFDMKAPIAIPKTNFLMLAKDEALATLDTKFDARTNEITIQANNEPTLQFSISDEAGRQSLANFLKRFLAKTDLSPEVVRSSGHKFTDISVVSPEKMRAISLINLASVRALEEKTGYKIDPMRFRANLYFDSEEPFVENSWLDKTITIGDVKLDCVMRTKRCPATEVNPDTGVRDIKIPYELRKHFGHFDMGIYAEVKETGKVHVDDLIQL